MEPFGSKNLIHIWTLFKNSKTIFCLYIFSVQTENREYFVRMQNLFTMQTHF